MSRVGILGALLAAAALALAGATRWGADPAVLAVEAPPHPPSAAPPATESGPVALEVPLPMPEPPARVAVIDPIRARLAAQRTRLEAWNSEFTETYREWSAAQLEARLLELGTLRSEAVTARFDELHERFEEHLEHGDFGARVVPVSKGSPFRPTVDARSESHRSARLVVDEAGHASYHLLEFDPRTDAVTSRLWAELAWVEHQASAR